LEFLVSDVRRDGNGSIYHVGATMMTWLLDNNPKVIVWKSIIIF
jgi:hypothetical protein